MKILFVVPNIEGRVGSPALNVALLSSFVNNRTGHKANIADLTFYKRSWKQYLKDKLDEVKPDLIGISVLTFDYAQALEIAAFIKTERNVKIIFGGVHAILMPNEVMSHKELDIICTGEGEYALQEILDNSLDCSGIKGIWYRDNGELIKNQQRTLIENLDELPFPDWDDFDLERYFLVNNNHLTLMASRGCPYLCTYCSNHALKKALIGKYVRFRSVDNVLEEVVSVIDKYPKRGFRYIYFIDDIFILNKEWVLEFCRKYKERGYNKSFRWMASVRANLVTEEIITALKEAGCYQVGMGIEAANDYIRNDIYKRNMSKLEIDNAVQIIKKSGLQLSTQFIIGAPYENIEMMEESLKMAKAIDADTIMFSLLMPLPGTSIRNMCKDEGLLEEEIFKHAQVMYSSPVAKTKFATIKEVKSFYNKARNYQIKKYVMEGLKRKGLIFLWDLLIFIIYYKPKCQLEIQNAFKFTINKYTMEGIDRFRHGVRGDIPLKGVR